MPTPARPFTLRVSGLHRAAVHPFNATDEWLSGWAGLKSVYQNPANPASTPSYEFSGTAGTPVNKGAVLRRGDGYLYRLEENVTIGGERCRQAHRNIARYHRRPDRGGIDGNADAGTTLTLDVSLPGIDASGVMLEPATGGADIETQESFRARMLLAYQKPPQGEATRTTSSGRWRYPVLPVVG